MDAMTILDENTYHPDVLSRIYRVLFLDVVTEIRWSNLIALRNAEFARYLSTPDTAAGTYQLSWSIRTGQMADTIERLNEKWHQIIDDFISDAVEDGSAKRSD